MVYYLNFYSLVSNIVAFHPIMGVLAAPCGLLYRAVSFIQLNKRINNKDDDESVDKFKTDEPVESNTTENAIETKLVEPEEESYKL